MSVMDLHDSCSKSHYVLLLFSCTLKRLKNVCIHYLRLICAALFFPFERAFLLFLFPPIYFSSHLAAIMLHRAWMYVSTCIHIWNIHSVIEMEIKKKSQFFWYHSNAAVLLLLYILKRKWIMWIHRYTECVMYFLTFCLWIRA